ncbi:MAG: ABC transporter permease [Phycisphaerae bacterium]|nr:ABC transporter permease [Phycisphaerae bacterium]
MLVLGAALFATVAIASAFNPAFATWANASELLSSCAPVLIVAAGATFVVLAGEIDVSVGSLYGALAALLGLLTSPAHAGWPAWAAVAVTIAAGAACGACNGLLVAYARLPSIIATLGTLSILRGVTELVMAGRWITDLPEPVRRLGTGVWLGITVSGWTALLAIVLAALVGARTRFGRRVRAVGDHPEAARLARIDTRLVTFATFTLSGIAAAAAALVTVPRLPVVEAGLGVGLELTVIAAIVVGGVSIRGGVGSLLGVALAAILLGMVRSVLVFMKLGPQAAYWEGAIQGAAILVAVLADRSRESRAAAHRPPPAQAGAAPAAPTLLALLALGTMGAWWAAPEFLVPGTQATLLPQVAEIALLAAPVLLVALAGGIDLSVGAAMALAGVAAGLAYESGVGPLAALACALTVGAGCGAVNGLCVVRGRVDPLVCTLATMALFRGLAVGLSGGRPMSGFPDWWTNLGRATLVGAPVVLLPALLGLAAAWAFLRFSSGGIHARAAGYNETAARYCGIAVDRLRLAAYVASGLAAGLASCVFIARRSTAKADVGLGIELDVITALVLGGVSLSGGRGGVAGVALGVVLLHELRQFIAWKWYHDELIQVVVGGVLICGVLAGQWLSPLRRPAHDRSPS